MMLSKSVTLLALVTYAAMTSLVSAFGKDIEVKYFGTAVLYCNENETMISAGTRIFWITQHSRVYEMNQTDPLPKYIQLGGTPPGNNLNVSHIDDDAFGYYTCVMIDSQGTVTITRWGLNIDGADFSELEEEYRHNAIVGAIAAAVMLVLVGGGCAIWNHRYARRLDEMAAKRKSGGSSIEDEDDLKKPTTTSQTYHNAGYDHEKAVGVDDVTTKVEEHADGAQDGNGVPQSDYSHIRM